MKLNKKSTIIKVSIVAIAVNLFLTTFNMVAGILNGSIALISDGINSLSDIFATGIVIVGAIISAKKSDSCHAYGHEKIECLCSILLSFILALTGILIGFEAVKSLINGSHSIDPSALAIAAASTSIVAKEGLYWFAIINAKKLNSSSLKADAWHHRSDALCSIASLLGVLFSSFGFPQADAIAGLLICLALIKVAIDVFMEASKKLTDRSCDQETVDQIRKKIEENTNVRRIDEIKTRQFADRAYIDIEIAVDSDLSLIEAHSIAESVHLGLESSFDYIKHCTVHVNPYECTNCFNAKINADNATQPQECKKNCNKEFHSSK